MCTGPKQRAISLAGITFALVSGMVVGNAQDRPPTSLGASAPPISTDFPFESRYLDVLDAENALHRRGGGRSDPVSFTGIRPLRICGETSFRMSLTTRELSRWT